jgi:hypothetical protein
VEVAVAVAGWQCGSGSGQLTVGVKTVRIYGNMAVFGVKMMPRMRGIRIK